jgi:DNA-binding CsgD family transcriptional regulator
MMSPEAVALMREKLRSMTIEEFTRDPRLTRIYERYQKETGGTVDDFVMLDKKSNLPNWSNLTANRLEAALEGLLVRIDAHLTKPTKEEAHCGLPPLDDALAERLRKVGMEAITPIVRLNNCYADSLALSLYAFAYRTNRMSIRNWGTKSERQFLDALTLYARSLAAGELQVAEPTQSTRIDQDMSVFLKMDDDDLKYFYLRNFAEIQKAIRANGLDKMIVSQIAAEMNLKWPYKYRTRQLQEYLFEDKEQLFHTQSLGKKKIRTTILCLIWAAKGSKRDMNRFSEMSPDELMEASPLSANEKQALTLRFLGEEPRTLEEAGRIMNVTRERVRQHQKTAETKLRTLGINQFAREWLRANSSKIWAMLSDDDGESVDPSGLKGGIRRCVPGEVLLAAVLAGWSLDDVLSLEGDPIDDWWKKKSRPEAG